MNVESWPQSPTAHGSLADAFRAAGNLEDASSAYERAIELAEQTEPMHLRTFRARLEEVKRQIEGAEEANAPIRGR
jgi:predicted RNA polymerase sigma factor